MHPKFHCFIHFLIALALGLAGVAAAQAQSPADQPPPATLHGHVADPTGALIPGATITITTATGAAVKTATADASGTYTVRGLAPGSYIVHAAFNGFASFQSQPIELEAGQSKAMDISLAIATAQQNVVVSEEGAPTVSVEADSNASSVVLKGSDLDALSDDPDELQNELSALAGPAAGPNGGQIYIDGFTGGQLPPKSAIREIRINQNPFSAEFDRIGYGRIEILTKPGTDVLHGRFFGMGNDNNFNTGNPFAPAPPYHKIQYNGSVSGSLSKSASFFISVEGRNDQDASIYSILDGPLYDAASNTYALNSGALSGSLFNPATHTVVTPRVDLQLGQKDTLTLRYEFYRNNVSGAIGATSLPSQATNSDSISNTYQLMDSHIINDHIVNETRLEYRRGSTTVNPVSTTPTFHVTQVFTGGGSSGQFSIDHTGHLELQNVTTMSAGAHAIKFGTWLRDNRDANFSNGNFNGSFVFPSISAFVDTWNGVAQGKTIQQIAAGCTDPNGCTPTLLTYSTGRESFLANVFDAALFYQDDWKVNRFLTLSGGLRWETQNHIPDHSDWGPRFAFAYALDGHKKGQVTKTVVRGGYGLFYDRFGRGSLMTLERHNGGPNSQTQVSITDPTCFSGTSLSTINGGVASCGTGSAIAPRIYELSPNYRSPLMQQLGLSLERQLTKSATLTFTYLHSYGVHQMATRNANAYLPGTYQYGSKTLTGVRPNPSLGIVQEFYPEAIFKQNQFIMHINANVTPNFRVMGFYNITTANSDTGTASNSYDLKQNYGRAAFVSKQMLFLMGNYSGPWGLTFNPFLVAQAGRPFDFLTPYDLTGDTFVNDRPAYATSASLPQNVVHTSYGNFDTVPQPGETIVAPNLGNGPAHVAVNLRISRSIGVGPKVEPIGGGRPGRPGGFAGIGFGGGPGGGHGGHGGGPGGPGGRGGMSNTGRKYSLTFSVQALNMFNNINYGTPLGNVVSPSFGRSDSLAGGIFSTPSAARRIFFQTFFSF